MCASMLGVWVWGQRNTFCVYSVYVWNVYNQRRNAAFFLNRFKKATVHTKRHVWTQAAARSSNDKPEVQKRKEKERSEEIFGEVGTFFHWWGFPPLMMWQLWHRHDLTWFDWNIFIEYIKYILKSIDAYMHICDRNLNGNQMARAMWLPCDLDVEYVEYVESDGLWHCRPWWPQCSSNASGANLSCRISDFLMRSTRSSNNDCIRGKDDMTYIHIYPYIYLCHMYIYICANMLYLHVLIPFDYTQLLRIDDVMMKTSILEPENWSRPRLRYRSAISWWWRWSKMTKWQSLTKWQKHTNSCGFERFGTNEWCVRTVFFLSSPVLTAFSFLQDSKIR